MIHFNSSKILIPVDFSETSLLAIKHGASIAKHEKSELYLLHVVNAPFMSQNMFLPIVNLEDNSGVEKIALSKLTDLAKSVKAEYGIEVQSIIKIGNPSNEITNVANEIGAALIVMGTHGYSPIEELVIGSNALKVITKANCPTMAMSIAAENSGYKKIVMPIDTTVNSRQKVNYTLEMAKRFNASVHAIGLLGNNEENELAGMEVVLNQVKKLAEEKGVTYQSEVLKDVKNRATATVDYINKINADLTIIMTDQDAELSGFFLGPYSQQVIHLSKVPVIAVKPKDLFIDDVNLPITGGI
jgi:nucleotide-binding universal stress UspA family protein